MEINKNSKIEEIFNLAIKNHLGNNLKDAQHLYNKILKIDPNHLSTLNNLGELLTKLGNFQEARNLFEKSLQINPNLASAYNNLGLIHKKLNNNILAENNFKKAIELNPNLANAHYNLGIIFREKGEYENAKTSYEKVIKIFPNHINSFNNLGILYDELGMTQKAKESYKEALKINPNYVDALWNSHILASDINETLSILQKLCDVDKHHLKSKIIISGLEKYKGNSKLFNDILNSENSTHPYTRSLKWIFSLPKLPKIFFNRWSFFDAMLTLADSSKPFYEFGVWNGVSFKYLLKTFKKGYGFDTFTGIPDTWHNEPKGNYTNFGKIPQIKGGEFIVGKFEDSLPKFFSEKRPVASLINFDADLYSSTICALNYSKEVITENTILIFDEFIMNNKWEEDEFKALNEFCINTGNSYEVLAFSLSTKQVAVKLKKN